MDESVFRFIWRYSKSDQIRIIGIVLLSLPFYFLSLDLPKTIVNDAIQGEGFVAGGTRTAFSLGLPGGWWGGPVEIFSGVELERVSFLVWMSLAFLVLVIVNGLFKLVINTAKGRLGERMLRRLRFMLFDRILRFPFLHFRKVKAPELATMVKDEIEPLGGFIGDAYVQPVFLGGQTLTALAFIITQNVWLGVLAGAIALFQAILIPRLRAPILELGRKRQLTARDLAGRIGEAVDGIEQIYVNDTARFERANMATRLGNIFWIRFKLYQKKFSVKFINNMLSQLTPFLFYLIGGYLAIKGKLDVGQLVAVIVAYKDLPGPMKELIDWDQRRQDTQIKYEQVISQFAPSGLADPDLARPREGKLDGPLILSNVTVAEDGEAPTVDHVSASLNLDESVALTGSGAARVIEAVARLRVPASGEIKFGRQAVADVPNNILGENVAYLGGSVYLHGPTLYDALAYSLKRNPDARGGRTGGRILEAQRTGNSLDDPDVDWIDYDAAGVADTAGLQAAMLDALNIVEMEDDLYRWGLREPVRPESIDADRILLARQVIAERLDRDELSMLVERFDATRYCSNATIAENLRFGSAVSAQFSDKALTGNAQMRDVLRSCGLYDRLIEIGGDIGKTLLEIFADISPDNPLIEQYSFVEAAELPNIRAALERTPQTDADKDRLLSLAFAYVDVRHRLDVLDDALKAQIVEARHAFRETQESADQNNIAFYDPEAPTPGARLVDDILFGRISERFPRSRERVEALIFEALDRGHLLPVVLDAGLAHEIGPGGRRLTASQKQRIGLARAILRRPQVLLLNDAMVVVDEMQAHRILTKTVGLRRGKGTFAALARPQYANIFDRRISFENGVVSADVHRETALGDSVIRGGLDDEVAVLAKIPLFANFEVSTLKLLAFASKRVTFHVGQDLFRQGDEADRAYVVISGAADVFVDGADGPMKIASVDSGEFVGEVGLLSDGSRSASVRASQELVALEITKELFFRMMQDFPSVSIEVMQDLAKRLQNTTAKVVEARGG